MPSHHCQVQHTRASFTINENCASDVQDDTETFAESDCTRGGFQGSFKVGLHLGSTHWKCKSTMSPCIRCCCWTKPPHDLPPFQTVGAILEGPPRIPITDGRLNMGTWQGIWLCEHRDHTTHKIVIALNGM
ncbi:UPF0047 protein YjbQ-like [Zingiber officinale]|uniref:UPF0047 protein YjbQ-like n=1 Tax=Zingiber officinale TaxID=94328 RepID=UPI001C4D8226|nr:UPF0047 protein YjbQ-like [Zingiber officinale]